MGSDQALRCGRCGHAHDAGSNFCSHCGLQLRPASPPGAYTPRHLAEEILHSRAAMEGERKQVTVLFVDVKNSVELARRVGAEAWHRLLNRFLTLLAEGVHRFEGTVNQYTGDGIMALFGAPLAHEDHAQRACHAALFLRERLRPFTAEMKKAHRLRFVVRMGLNSGEVVVGRIGDDLRMDYTALGDTVGLAARMEQAAAPGAVYLTGNTAALVAGFFTLTDRGTRRVKGAEGPVRVFTLEGSTRARTRLDVARGRGFRRFLGRGAEMARLRQALEQARAGHGQVVGIAGVPGVGKSRLCQEFADDCRAQGLAVAEAHCPAHGRALPYFAAVELLRSYFALPSGGQKRTARALLDKGIRRLGRSFRRDQPMLLDLFDLAPRSSPAGVDPARHRDRLFAFAQRLVQTASARAPLVLLVDDAQWLDDDSGVFLERLVDAVGWTRTLLLVNFRSDFHPKWSALSYYQRLDLSPLGAAASEDLLSDLFHGDDATTAGLRAHILERAAGVPFFVEEMVQALVQRGTAVASADADGLGPRYRLRPGEQVPGDVAVPATIQSLLAARIDRLGERDKAILQTAAVIGKQFAAALLQRTLDNLAPPADDASPRPPAPSLTALEALAAADFICADGDGAYSFRHPLTQEVAYQSQLGDQRCRVHEAVARALETLHADRLGQRAALIAHHWSAAQNAGQRDLWRYRAALQVTNIQVARERGRARPR